MTGGFTVGAPANGVITVTSTVPTNGTFRTLEFTVKCADKTEKVIIRHYPADFITGISSSWSSYAASGWAEKGVSGKTYTSSYVSSGGSFRFDDDTDDRFHAHMYYNGHVYLLKKDGTRGGNDNLGDATNNQMYVLQITAASDNYRLGRPELTTQSATVYNRDGYNLGTVQYFTSDDNVLSPAFMLGSQLGVNLAQYGLTPLDDKQGGGRGGDYLENIVPGGGFIFHAQTAQDTRPNGDYSIAGAFDDNVTRTERSWMQNWGGGAGYGSTGFNLPYWLLVDMQEEFKMGGIEFWTRADRRFNMKKVEVYALDDCSYELNKSVLNYNAEDVTYLGTLKFTAGGQCLSISLEPVTTRYIMMLILESGNGLDCQELVLWGC